MNAVGWILTMVVRVAGARVVVSLVLATLVAGVGVLAEAEESADLNSTSENWLTGEHVQRSPASAARNGVSRKRYPGGADEDDLQVQPSLPIPSRSFDGTVTNTAAEAEESGSAPAAND